MDDLEIPFRCLPPGFAELVPEEPGGSDGAAAARPTPRIQRARPAATLVLLRPGGGTGPSGTRRQCRESASPAPGAPPAAPEGTGLQVLLLRRSPGVSFVPGAWVFPGGGLEGADGGPGSREILGSLDLTELERSMRVPADAPPPHAFLVAAYRETLEETGILPAARGEEPAADLRRRLLAGEADFQTLLHRGGIRLDGAEPLHLAHWVSPELEGRRYDTRFFAVRHTGDPNGSPQPGEGVELRWITPNEALRLHYAGHLPLIFPTLATLQALTPFRTPGEVAAHFRRRPIHRILPRLHRTLRGVRMVVDDTAVTPAP